MASPMILHIAAHDGSLTQPTYARKTLQMDFGYDTIQISDNPLDRRNIYAF